MVEAEVVRVFPNLEFERPVYLAQAPGDSSKWYVATQTGLVWRFENEDQADTRTVSLDLQEQLRFTGSRHSQQWGITSLAFHPQFPDQPYLYIAYNAAETRQSLVESVVARFETTDGGQTFDPASETTILSLTQDIVIEQNDEVSRFHHLGHIAFGQDGYLYIGFGDPNGSTAQDLSNWHGSILRIDVDRGEPYTIPPDNPFVGMANIREEIFAYGLRNPWRFSIDRETEELWAGDVGWNSWEEIDLVVSGGNYGWKIMEGNHCVEAGCDPSGLIPPVIEYSHDIGRIVIGGFVYRGQAIPELTGSYVFGDGTSRDIWRIVDDADGSPQRQNIARVRESAPHTFAQDLAGELYFTSARSAPQGLQKIIPAAASTSGASAFPTTLSQTGCVNPADPQAAAEGTVPYGVNSALWSDGATVRRWMAIPDDTQLVAQPDGDMTFPIGTVLVENFSFDSMPVETRLLIRHDDGGWAGYSYEWLDDGSDAVLLEDGKIKELANGQTWIFPSRTQCLACHTQVAGYALGLELAQLNGAFTYPSTGRTANQLVTLSHIGYLHDPQERLPEQLPALAAVGDDSRPVEDRVRSYWHANCSGCHRPEGPTPALTDFRFFVDIEAIQVCHVAPQLGDLGIEDAELIAPGAPERSIVYQRMNRRGPRQMPPLATSLVDTTAVDVLEQWILSEDICADTAPADKVD
ncbi:PQQ-dependent sugar dehydrogenase [Candidatus Entotheonella palauensis]|uniref:PQQ-dependent sugar dehydrogenase n=1 Tax=Candidatus Entotheonella palauensis TaxID=93172 RepID=UPI0021183C45|nr:PQQ-dependent sugar dehydrogenase [Candidatus Entotheonella palauensis]